MTTVQVGRFVSSYGPSNIRRRSDNGLVFTALITNQDPNVTRAMCDQIALLDGGVEVPVVFSDDNSWLGIWRLNAATIAPTPTYLVPAGGVFVNFDLTRVRRLGASSIVEQSQTMALRTNAIGITVEQATSTIVFSGVEAGRWNTLPAPAATGTATGIIIVQLSATSQQITDNIRGKLAVPEFYDGSAVLEQDIGGVWMPVTGDVITETDPSKLRVSNGIMRFWWSNPGTGEMAMQRWTGTEWGTPYDTFIVNMEGANVTDVEPPAVVTNEPEAVTVTFPFRNVNIADGLMSLRLCRGAHTAEFTFTRGSGAASPMVIGHSSGASQGIQGAFTWGKSIQSNGPGLFPYIIVTPTVTGTPATDGTLTAPAVTEHFFGIGLADNPGSTEVRARAYMTVESYRSYYH